MTLQQFMSLPGEVQMNTISNNGVYLGKRKAGNHVVFLYQIDSFYIEVFYHRQKNKVTKLRSFRSTAILEPYLRQVSLKHLF